MLIEDIMQYLDDKGVARYEPDGDGTVFMGEFPASPDHCIVVRSTGGLGSDAKLPYDNPTVQIMVRGRSDPRPPYNKAREVYETIHGLHSLQMGSTWVISIIAVQSEPAEIGKDDNGRYRFSQNYQFEVYNTTEQREG